MKLKSFLAIAFMFAIILAGSALAFGSPPTATKDKPAIVQVQSTVASQVSPIFVQTDIDRVLAWPADAVTVAGEKAKAQRYERRFTFTQDSSYQEPSRDVETPPNETRREIVVATYNGFANTRAREQV
jgi:hypothetical protein